MKKILVNTLISTKLCLEKISLENGERVKSRDKTVAAMLASLNCGLSGALQPVSGWLFGGSRSVPRPSGHQ